MVTLHDRLGGGMESARSGVVAEALPGSKYLFFRGGGEIGERGEAFHPVGKARGHGRDSGLLEHELGNEHGIGIMRFAPWQIVPAMLLMPLKERFPRLVIQAFQGLVGSCSSFWKFCSFCLKISVLILMPPPLHTQTFPLTPEQAEKLRSVLQERGFSFEEKPYMLYAARKEKLTIAVYEKGPKAVVQGRGLEDFISFVMEPEILGEARLGYEEVHSPEQFEPHFGIDESGKGDLFGPLVIAGVYLDGNLSRQLRDAGVQDSKAISSDKKIRDLAAMIRKSGAPSEVIVLKPERYNELYASIGNLNRLLAWGHARVIENLCARVPDCPRALSDKFADARVLQKALLEHGRKIQLDQRTKAESDYAVAAASILAREAFIDWLERSGKELGVVLAKGASPKVKAAAATLIAEYGAAMLPKVAKMHFKTASEVLAKVSAD